ncbi:hypothetical protein [Nibrella viscosa]|uniref:hypothetical protein n=1 Tax=Nibrella viscosa TaxID=1084524 RepID=UPI0031E61518
MPPHDALSQHSGTDPEEQIQGVLCLLHRSGTHDFTWSGRVVAMMDPTLQQQ